MSDIDRNFIIARACEAYMLEKWVAFRTLVADLDERGKQMLIQALYVP